MIEDEMVRWHHQFSGHEFEQAPGVGDGQRSLTCHNSWDHKDLDTLSELNQMLGCWGIFWHLSIWHLAVSVAAGKFHLETPA